MVRLGADGDGPEPGLRHLRTAEGDTYELPQKIFSAQTIFEALNPTVDGSFAGVDWAIVYQYQGPGAFDPAGSVCYTEGRFLGVQRALRPTTPARSTGRLVPYDAFLAGLAGGDLPAFTWVEPWWGWGRGNGSGTDFIGYQGNDYHPPAWVGPAEADLAALYEAVVRSPKWERTLLLIVFDEHGGLYDHVRPPKAEPPDVVPSPFGFAFDRFGPRVPAILVTPYVAERSVFRADATPDRPAPFDHTSIIRTVLEWAGRDDATIASFGGRVRHAPSFAGVLADVALQPPSPAAIEVPPGFAAQCRKGERGLDFDASMLTVLDHRAADAAAASDDEYLAALRQLAAGRANGRAAGG